ncbi:hypothetical protein RCC89_05025 [Cytophagaceae bacterium ABcell3]|nr:hypothetical protein RCC89_05025 [Cytophagaceae bacterium ABcell3]
MNKLLMFVLFLGCFSCKKSFNSESEFYRWLNEGGNGFVVSKEAGVLKMEMKYLPPEYLVFKEFGSIQDLPSERKDSLLGLYNNSLSFLLKIGYKDPEHGDLLKNAVENYAEYSEMLMELNFQLNDYFSLHFDGQKTSPVLAKMEDSYGLQPHRTIYLVFPKPEKSLSDDMKIVFTDYLFSTGITKFSFDHNKISDIPEFHF